MQNDLIVWNFILKHISSDIPVILMVVPESSGSSPGRTGFKMAVTLHELCGSIGGGIMEHKFVELAKEKLRTDDENTILKKQVHDKQAKRNQSGMICSGEQSIILFTVHKNDIDQITSLVDSMNKYLNGKLIIEPDKLIFEKDAPTENYKYEFQSEEKWKYEERTGFKNKLFIVGGGHCGLAFSRLMRMLDFYITIIDDRPDLNTMASNNYVHEKYFVKDYSELKEMIPSGKEHYVVIMTFGYRTDDLALRSVIHNNYKYLGVLGSKNKMKQLMEEWKRDGIPEEKLSRIHTPIGLPIHSQTPEEIAISIAAEIISVKNN